ncbi:hypothetical protein Aab01nite_45130 [Paractinoplanes abujensis]|uniref:Diguanylate cyclase (GGDEF)-like protein n=1 Tax=Paractinoplanes abujensis TaxID=882441 RepID=A0A7W7CN54_9ACTN|nr:GGDEF domain-containing protein [Actinoplanes abujensis]MBB4690155.1 diguanylate cyclase (GGDEF)-like protein [Actinoplanes abujensis]GID20923.1 hypothetical protein Aab01nite_45130 [Actinoplanes abujensis]
MAKSTMLPAQYTVYAVTVALVLGGAATGLAPAEKIAGPAMLWFDLVMVPYGIRACRHPGLDPAIRRFAQVLTAVLALTATVTLIFLITGTKAFPQVGDAVHLLVTVILFVALMTVPVRRMTTRERWKTLLDAGTVAVGASMVLWYLVIGPALLGSRSWPIVLAAACYPVVDLLALFGLARVLIRGTRHISRRTFTMLGGAVFALLIGDSYIGYAQAHTAVVERSTFSFLCWLTTHFLLACGAIELWRQVAHPAENRDTRQRGAAAKIPYGGIGVGYLLMAIAAVREGSAFPWPGLVLGSMAITGLVVLRQVLVQSEITEAAETDVLTGLANRARLHDELARSLRRNARTAVLLIDLNGFKQVNDTLGHQAGDDLLVAVADAMRSSVRPDDVVGRLGGDEFAVLVRSVTDRAGAAAVAGRISAAIAGPFVIGDRPVTASASIGVAVSAPGSLDVDELLHRADVAMYEQKRNERNGGGRNRGSRNEGEHNQGLRNQGEQNRGLRNQGEPSRDRAERDERADDAGARHGRNDERCCPTCGQSRNKDREREATPSTSEQPHP